MMTITAIENFAAFSTSTLSSSYTMGLNDRIIASASPFELVGSECLALTHLFLDSTLITRNQKGLGRVRAGYAVALLLY